MRHLLDSLAIDDLAIRRLQSFEAEALAMSPDGYWLAFSGGKDSVVILDLAKRAGVKFQANYSLTTVDPPELVWFVKTFPEVAIHRPAETMWQLIRRNGMPPRRNARYCCAALKESGGGGHIVITGVRWAESARRSKRQMMEACHRSRLGRKLFHPIIEWSTSDVWQYIRERGLRYCSLYDEGFRRLGCVLCPMQTQAQTERDRERFPKLCAQWERTVKSTFRPATMEHGFRTAEEYWQWWLDRDAEKLDSSPVLFEDNPELSEPGLEAG